jgi:hypothetical protein
MSLGNAGPQGSVLLKEPDYGPYNGRFEKNQHYFDGGAGSRFLV